MWVMWPRSTLSCEAAIAASIASGLSWSSGSGLMRARVGVSVFPSGPLRLLAGLSDTITGQSDDGSFLTDGSDGASAVAGSEGKSFASDSPWVESRGPRMPPAGRLGSDDPGTIGGSCGSSGVGTASSGSQALEKLLPNDVATGCKATSAAEARLEISMPYSDSAVCIWSCRVSKRFFQASRSALRRSKAPRALRKLSLSSLKRCASLAYSIFCAVSGSEDSRRPFGMGELELGSGSRANLSLGLWRNCFICACSLAFSFSSDSILVFFCVKRALHSASWWTSLLSRSCCVLASA